MKQATVVANKTQAQVYVLEESSRINTEKRQHMEGLLNGMGRELVEQQQQMTLLKIHDSRAPSSSRTDSYSETSESTVRRTGSSVSGSAASGNARVAAPGPWAAATQSTGTTQWASSPAGARIGYDPQTAVDPFAFNAQ